MAELLVYIGTHWFNALSVAEQNMRPDKSKFDGVNVSGDVIQVEEDGYWTHPVTGKGYRKDKYAVVIAPGSKSEYTYLLKKDRTNFIHKRRYRVTNIISDKLALSKKEDLIVEDKLSG